MATNPAIGILGGTFDPVHLGHLRLAEEMREHFALTEVRFIPAGDPYQKTRADGSARRSITPAAQRMTMLRDALRPNPHFTADEREMHRSGPSYSIETAVELRREFGASAALIWLVGSDTFLGMPTWQRWNELFDHVHVAIAERAGNTGWRNAMADALLEQFERRVTETAQDLIAAPAGRVAVVSMTALDISSTAVRAQLKAGQSARYLVPESALDYIQQHQLYSREGDGH